MSNFRSGGFPQNFDLFNAIDLNGDGMISRREAQIFVNRFF